jgi:hypothetical protein
MEDYEVWSNEPNADVSDHKIIARGLTKGHAATICGKKQSDADIEYILSVLDGDKITPINYYYRRKNEPTYRLYLVKGDERALVETCYSKVIAKEKYDKLSANHVKYNTGYKVEAKQVKEKRSGGSKSPVVVIRIL